MDIKKLDLETLEYVKRICDFQSDMSSRTIGYSWLERTIEELKCVGKKPETSDEALPIAGVVKSWRYCECCEMDMPHYQILKCCECDN